MSEPTEKQTPRTTAEIAERSINGPLGSPLVLGSFARQLETELAAVEAQAAAMRETLTRSRETFLWLLDRHGAQSAKLRAEEIYAALESTNAGAELLDRLSKAEALAIQMTDGGAGDAGRARQVARRK